MNNLLSAIMTKLSGSALYNDVGGRIFLDTAPEGTEFPYVVFFIVSDVPEKTFTEDFENIIIQFSLFSASAGVTEISTMYNDLTAVLDECSLTITGYTHIWMNRQNLTTMVEEITVQSAVATVKHWAVDYDIKISLD